MIVRYAFKVASAYMKDFYWKLNVNMWFSDNNAHCRNIALSHTPTGFKEKKTYL